MKKLTLLITIILMISCRHWDKDDGLSPTGNSQYVDTLKEYLIIDGKRVSEEDFDKAWDNYELKYEYGSNGSRDALLRFGEKYRKGICSFKIIEEYD